MYHPILCLPRSLFDNEVLSGSTMDLFDPYDEFDVEVFNNNLKWIRKPMFTQRSFKPNVSSKYRTSINVNGYKPESLKVEIKKDHLIVTGIDETKLTDDTNGGDAFIKKEFYKSFKLPENVEHEKMLCFLSKLNQMIVDIPYKSDAMKSNKIEMEIFNNGDVNAKKLIYRMKFENLDWTKLQIGLKDYDVIISYELSFSRLDEIMSFRTANINIIRLPDNVDMQSNTVNCMCDGDVIKIEADLLPELQIPTLVPIHHFVEPTLVLSFNAQQNRTNDVEVATNNQENIKLNN